MANPTTDIPGYWDRYAQGVAPPDSEEESAPVFEWTQYPGHGPGAELLGEPAYALELGSGRGEAVAALASTGVMATGVDISPVQVDQARKRWGHLGAEFHREDVVAFLRDADQRWDAIYSVWGAVWFTDPEVLLPLVHERLEPGGRLVFSHAQPVPGAYGVQGIYGSGFHGRQVWIHRWAYEPEMWEEILTGHGFSDVEVWVEPAPESGHVGTLIGVASR
ncbi:bifunctional 2-polyprenyl-6-hydroxyphenol methylase/3-demethylubiquinol 3-O-methyltransferase UbiG [Nocardiopsis sp. NRRL B-16309]|uniref:class I SAM-dependent methyltransferase n=1 Tax=Nocardiopsis sp. NRRL B-16309 TaxID=1519494 RepID=UPI0006B037F2|nr:class I SAM-dependent methyltransferase [Nocardiopsis sp. NRRL B-16309]KOX16951.1 methyltransferase type 11 [Nocardiopsis sp. NRRL B-16309]